MCFEGSLEFVQHSRPFILSNLIFSFFLFFFGAFYFPSSPRSTRIADGDFCSVSSTLACCGAREVFFFFLFLLIHGVPDKIQSDGGQKSAVFYLDAVFFPSTTTTERLLNLSDGGLDSPAEELVVGSLVFMRDSSGRAWLIIPRKPGKISRKRRI